MSAKQFWMGVVGALWALGSWAQIEGGIQRSDWRSRFVEPVTQSLQISWDGLLDFRTDDFDGDGAVDLIFVDRRGLWVCWGSAGQGLEEAYNLLGERAAIHQIAFEHKRSQEAYPPLLWVKRAVGSKRFEVSAYKFDGRELVPFRNLSMAIAGHFRCTGNGLIVGEGEDGQLMLERNGAMLHLGRVSGHVEDLDFVDLNGDGFEDAIVQQSQRLKVALGMPSGGLGAWKDIETAAVESWDVAVDVNGVVGIAVQTDEVPRLTFWTVGAQGIGSSPLDQRLFGSIINHHSTQMDGTVLMHNRITSSLIVLPFRSDGVDFGTEPLAELEPNSLIRLSDWDGDGDDDVVALHEGNRTLTWVPYVGPSEAAQPRWSRNVLQTLVDTLGSEFTCQLNTSNQWRREVDWSPAIDQWAVASSGIWGVGETVSMRNAWRHQQHAEAESRAVSELETCVEVGYLVFEERVDRCLKMDLSREWHRLTYSRDELGRTFVVIDDELRFVGSSEGRRFDHRMLHLGAFFGTTWRSYSAIEVDDVSIHRGAASPEALLDWQRSGKVPEGLERAVGFDFEGEHPELPLDGGQVLNIDAGAEVVRKGRGNVLRMDGATGRAHGFVDIPERTVVFDVTFKLNRESDEPQALASFYGMHNLNFTLRPGRPLLGLVKSPAEFELLEAEDSRGGYLMTYRGGVLRMLPSGEWLVPTDTGWELMESKALPFGWAHAAPWVQDGVAYAVFGNRGKVWRCLSPELGWTEFAQLNRSRAGFNRVVSTGQWALVWNDDRSLMGWLDVEAGAFYRQSAAAVPEEPHAVRPGRGGVEFMDARGKWWLVEPPSRESAYEAAFRSGQPWLWGMTAFACASAFGFFTIRMRKRNVPVISEEEPQIEASVAHTLNQLRPRAGDAIDADELDALLGIGAIDTPETRRSRRNRAINDLNAWSRESRGHAWVNRTRDASDRRRAMYELSGDMKNCCLESDEGVQHEA